MSPALPINGGDIIMGNELAGCKVMPVPEVLDSPDLHLESVSITQPLPEIFHACVVTPAQSKKYGIDPSDSFSAQKHSLMWWLGSNSQPEAQSGDMRSSLLGPGVGNFPATRDKFSVAQQAGVTLLKCHSTEFSHEAAKQKNVSYAYVHDNGLLMRCWTSVVSENEDWGGMHQVVVVPTVFHSHVLSLAHDHPRSGHMGGHKEL